MLSLQIFTILLSAASFTLAAPAKNVNFHRNLGSLKPDDTTHLGYDERENEIEGKEESLITGACETILRVAENGDKICSESSWGFDEERGDDIVQIYIPEGLKTIKTRHVDTYSHRRRH